MRPVYIRAQMEKANPLGTIRGVVLVLVVPIEWGPKNPLKLMIYSIRRMVRLINEIRRVFL